MKTSAKPFTDRQIATLVVKRGKFYRSSVLPKDIPRGDVGICFDWCALQAAKNRKYRYVEGLASNPENPEDWLLHAWLTDGENAYDPTWSAKDDDGVEHPVPSQYLGIEMDIEKVANFMTTTGYQGVIANHYRNEQIWKEILA